MREPSDVVAQSGKAALANLFVGSFAYDQTSLPIIAAIDEDEDLSIVQSTKQLTRIGGLARDDHPEHVHRRAEIGRLESSRLAYRRLSAIAADDEIGVDVLHTGWRFRLHSSDPIAVKTKSGDLRFHL